MTADLARHMTEDELLACVIDACRKFGLRCAHFRPAKTERGWRTAVQGDGKGFPDLVITSGNTVLFVELKSERGRLTPEQRDWLDDLMGVEGRVEVCIWRPADWIDGTIESVLLAMREQRQGVLL